MDGPLSAVKASRGEDEVVTPSRVQETGRQSVVGFASVDEEIADLESRLLAAKYKRSLLEKAEGETALLANHSSGSLSSHQWQQEPQQQQQHFLLLLSDSALPLGSFAFSSGLESFLAHDRAAAAAAAHSLTTGLKAGSSGSKGSRPDAFAAFLPLSVSSYAHTSLPFVLAAHDAAADVSADTSSSSPSLTETLTYLDDTFDATLVCAVGRRASVAQGRALLSVWERAFAPALREGDKKTTTITPSLDDPLRPFSLLVKKSSNPPPGVLPEASAHLPPLFGAVAALAGLGRRQAADVFVLGHVKALVSAAVRASLLGPYQAQRLLASPGVRQLVGAAVVAAWARPVEGAGQTAPAVDLWMGRHELLYSRIFNS